MKQNNESKTNEENITAALWVTFPMNSLTPLDFFMQENNESKTTKNINTAL